MGIGMDATERISTADNLKRNIDYEENYWFKSVSNHI